MLKRRSNKYTRKRLRHREKQLREHLDRLLSGFNPDNPHDDRSNFRLLLRVRWLVYDFIYLRLKLNPRWQKRQWFLELFDVDEVRITNSSLELIGDIVWWAEGKDAIERWWPADHEPHRVGPYKLKIRGDLSGGCWVLEPLIARLRTPKLAKRNADYEIEFGKGSTYMMARSKGWRKAV
jgi:hypothetical protein